MSFEISMGVRKSDEELRQQIDDVLRKEQPAIQRILNAFGVPLASE